MNTPVVPQAPEVQQQVPEQSMPTILPSAAPEEPQVMPNILQSEWEVFFAGQHRVPEQSMPNIVPATCDTARVWVPLEAKPASWLHREVVWVPTGGSASSNSATTADAVLTGMSLPPRPRQPQDVRPPCPVAQLQPVPRRFKPPPANITSEQALIIQAVQERAAAAQQQQQPQPPPPHRNWRYEFPPEDQISLQPPLQLPTKAPPHFLQWPQIKAPQLPPSVKALQVPQVPQVPQVQQVPVKVPMP
jgi:hypothetical protein